MERRAEVVIRQWRRSSVRQLLLVSELWCWSVDLRVCVRGMLVDPRRLVWSLSECGFWALGRLGRVATLPAAYRSLVGLFIFSVV